MKNNAAADLFRYEGNAFFNKVNFYEALISYNKSLCYAEPRSVQLGLAYSNRSAVYLNMKEYEKCLDNIQLARDNNYPHEAKLKEREGKCKKQMTTHQPDTKKDLWTYFKLSYPANEKIPFIVNCLEIDTEGKNFHHIKTNRELQPGDVIAIERIHFPLVSKSALQKRCTFCFCSNMLNLIPCNCSSAMFCDQECLTNGRERFHGALCETIDSAYEQFNEIEILEVACISRGLLESLHIVERPESLRGLMSSSKPTTIFDYDLRGQCGDPETDLKYLSIINHLEEMPQKNLKTEFGRISSNVAKSLQRPEMEPLLTEYGARFAMIKYGNANGVPFHGKNEGDVIAPIRTLYSHSCDANIFTFLIENKCVHIVLKPIAKGGKLFRNYGFHLYDHPDRAQRQEALMKYFNFKCSCSACRNDYSVMSSPRYDPTFRFPTDEIPKTVEDIMIELKQRFDYIKKNFKIYPSYELYITEMRCRALMMLSIGNQSVWPYEMFN